MPVMQISDRNVDQHHAFHIFRQIHIDTYVCISKLKWSVKNVNQQGLCDVYALSRYFQ